MVRIFCVALVAMVCGCTLEANISFPSNKEGSKVEEKNDESIKAIEDVVSGEVDVGFVEVESTSVRDVIDAREANDVAEENTQTFEEVTPEKIEDVAEIPEDSKTEFVAINDTLESKEIIATEDVATQEEVATLIDVLECATEIAEVRDDDKFTQEDVEECKELDSSDAREEVTATIDIGEMEVGEKVEEAEEELMIEEVEEVTDSDWMLYENPEKGFKFFYPKSWMLIFDDGMKVTFDSQPDATENQENRVYAEVAILLNETGGSDNEFVENLKARLTDKLDASDASVKVGINGTGEHLALFAVMPLDHVVVAVNVWHMYPEWEELQDTKDTFAKLVLSFDNM